MFVLNSIARPEGTCKMRTFRLRDSKYSNTNGIKPGAVVEYRDENGRLKLGVAEQVGPNSVVLAENPVRHQKAIGVATIENVFPGGLAVQAT